MGIKDNKDKMRVELDWNFIEEMAKRMDDNKDKYPRDNWKNPIDVVELEDALIRHWFDYKRGDKSENHLAAIALNAMMIWYQKNNATSNTPEITPKDNWNNESVNERVKSIIINKNYYPKYPLDCGTTNTGGNPDWRDDFKGGYLYGVTYDVSTNINSEQFIGAPGNEE